MAYNKRAPRKHGLKEDGEDDAPEKTGVPKPKAKQTQPKRAKVPPAAKAAFPTLEAEEDNKPAILDKKLTTEEEEEESSQKEDLDTYNTEAPLRGIRYVFESRFSELPEFVQKAYNDEKLSRVPGKQARMNAIINAAVRDKKMNYRSSLRTDPVEWCHMRSKIDTRYKNERAEGYSYTELKAKLGSDQAIQDGIRIGDIEVEDSNQKHEFFQIQLFTKNMNSFKSSFSLKT